MNHIIKPKRKIIVFLVLVLTIILFNYFNIFKYIRFGIELLKINKSLPAVSCDFYNDPIDDITYKDVIYKRRGNQELTLDIYSSNKELNNGNPVIIYVYGDGWVSGSKTLPSTIEPLIDILRNEGYTIISTSYELMDSEVIFNKQISDVKDTIRWVYKNADIYNFDTSNIGIIAPSAGSQLSMIASFSNKDDFRGDLNLYGYETHVKYIIDMFGPTILSEINLDNAPKAFASKMKSMNFDIETLSEKFSPINYLKEDLPNTLVIHSKADTLVPYDTSLKFCEKANELGNDFQLYTLDNCSHYLDNLSEKEALELYLKIITFIINNS